MFCPYAKHIAGSQVIFVEKMNEWISDWIRDSSGDGGTPHWKKSGPLSDFTEQRHPSSIGLLTPSLFCEKEKFFYIVQAIYITY